MKLKPYGISRCAITNTQFAMFVAVTGYVTEAERFGWSFVFRSFVPTDLACTAMAVVQVPWWLRIEGADWRHPEGPPSTLEGRLDHPVVHVSWNDAQAYANWAGGRLSSEAEWEHAARGGTDSVFPWGNAEPSDHAPNCNISQGEFPTRNLASDGFLGTAPVRSFAPNPLGLYNMSGNVWEWCVDRFWVKSLAAAARRRNAEAVADNERTLKGGSYLCHRSYCHRYRIASRMGRAPESSTGHMGFRIAFDAAP